MAPEQILHLFQTFPYVKLALSHLLKNHKLEKVFRSLRSNSKNIKLFTLSTFHSYHYNLGVSKKETKTKKAVEEKEQSPVRHSFKTENLEIFASPDRILTNRNKISGKSTLRGSLYKLL